MRTELLEFLFQFQCVISNHQDFTVYQIFWTFVRFDYRQSWNLISFLKFPFFAIKDVEKHINTSVFCFWKTFLFFFSYCDYLNHRIAQLNFLLQDYNLLQKLKIYQLYNWLMPAFLQFRLWIGILKNPSWFQKQFKWEFLLSIVELVIIWKGILKYISL